MDINLNIVDETEDSKSKIEELLKRIEELKMEESKIMTNIKNKSKSNYDRTPWCSNLSEVELNRPGGLLLAALFSCANERRLQLNQMAAELGVSFGYINQLRNGQRNVTGISYHFATGCAKFLAVPRMKVFLLAGIVSHEDFFENYDMMASEISQAFGFICHDNEWEPLITPELRRVNIESQFAIVKLYELATGKVLLNRALDCKSLASEVLKFSVIQDQRQSTINAHSYKKSMARKTKKQD